MTDFEQYLACIKAQTEVVADLLGDEGIGHLRNHYEWNINYHEKHDEPHRAEEYRHKELMLETLIGYISGGLTDFIGARED